MNAAIDCTVASCAGLKAASCCACSRLRLQDWAVAAAAGHSVPEVYLAWSCQRAAELEIVGESIPSLLSMAGSKRDPRLFTLSLFCSDKVGGSHMGGIQCMVENVDPTRVSNLVSCLKVSPLPLDQGLTGHTDLSVTWPVDKMLDTNGHLKDIWKSLQEGLRVLVAGDGRSHSARAGQDSHRQRTGPR